MTTGEPIILSIASLPGIDGGFLVVLVRNGAGGVTDTGVRLVSLGVDRFMNDPRQPFADVADPIINEILSQWSPPLKKQHYEQLRREINDELFGREVNVVMLGQMLLDDEGQPIRCAGIDQGGDGPYQVIIRFAIVEMEQITT